MASILAVGQLAASSAALLTPGVERPAVSVTLHNGGAIDQEITLTITRHGSSTAYVIDHAILKTRETRRVRGLAIDPEDTLSGHATGGAAGDYTVMAGDGISVSSSQIAKIPKVVL